MRNITNGDAENGSSGWRNCNSTRLNLNLTSANLLSIVIYLVAAANENIVAIFSTIATSSIEEVAEAAPSLIRWFQLYIYKDRKLTENIVRRAERAGFKALVLTVDAPLFGLRRLDLKNKFSMPPHLTLANFQDVVTSMGGERKIETDVKRLIEFMH